MKERDRGGNSGQREKPKGGRVSRRRAWSRATQRLSEIRTERCPLARAISRSFVTLGAAVSVEWGVGGSQAAEGGGMSVKMAARGLLLAFVKLGCGGKKRH